VAIDTLYQNTNYIDIRILKDLIEIEGDTIPAKVYYESKKELIKVFISLETGCISFHNDKLLIEVFWYEDEHVCCKMYQLSELITSNRGLFGYKYDANKMHLNTLPISGKIKNLWNARFIKEYNGAE